MTLWSNPFGYSEEEIEPYEFPNRPAAKSSTNVLQASVCQRCGCKLDGKSLTKRCDCRCHTDGPIVRR